MSAAGEGYMERCIACGTTTELDYSVAEWEPTGPCDKCENAQALWVLVRREPEPPAAAAARGEECGPRRAPTPPPAKRARSEGAAGAGAVFVGVHPALAPYPELPDAPGQDVDISEEGLRELLKGLSAVPRRLQPEVELCGRPLLFSGAESGRCESAGAACWGWRCEPGGLPQPAGLSTAQRRALPEVRRALLYSRALQAVPSSVVSALRRAWEQRRGDVALLSAASGIAPAVVAAAVGAQPPWEEDDVCSPGAAAAAGARQLDLCVRVAAALAAALRPAGRRVVLAQQLRDADGSPLRAVPQPGPGAATPRPPLAFFPAGGVAAQGVVAGWLHCYALYGTAAGPLGAALRAELAACRERYGPGSAYFAHGASGELASWAASRGVAVCDAASWPLPPPDAATQHT
eukprot:TRINITY_DN4697_c5_g1_i1.p2 TRINITY_DN4697_c5_g1~~TRINITY_DN4697_c5_g1_i1.p2  ORF type:complete len:434 (+),score=99.49 TRINITY_DN4697_c5_g1_i1:88-1302(+)